MTEALSRRLKQARFTNPQQEAVLSLAVAAGTLNDLVGRDLQEAMALPGRNTTCCESCGGSIPKGHARCEIAQRMIDRAPDVTRLVDRLQARGLVRRTSRWR